MGLLVAPYGILVLIVGSPVMFLEVYRRPESVSPFLRLVSGMRKSSIVFSRLTSQTRKLGTSCLLVVGKVWSILDAVQQIYFRGSVLGGKSKPEWVIFTFPGASSPAH